MFSFSGIYGIRDSCQATRSFETTVTIY